MFINISKCAFCVIIASFFFACATSSVHKDLHSERERELTLGVVQKQIRKDMSQAEVAENLGSPNIVTKDGDGKETWVYDKIATEASYSNSEQYGTLLIIGAGKSSASYSSTQKTLTVVIKFNNESKVDSFTYHTSKF